MRVLMLGDSQLARLARYPRLIARETTNRAVGGATAPEVLDQLGELDPAGYDVVLLGVGTNDAGSRPVPLPHFLAAIESVIGRLAGTPLVFVTSPGADARAVGYDDAHMARYAVEASAVVRAAGGTVVETPAVIARLGRAGRTPDGIHISQLGHLLYVPALRRAARRAQRS
ncbi:SGNH/GDSL hydrolase family protein [Nocardioides cavernaquae]|uniref:SGNH/GDSL hydrolase family protein n=1 Tax=Nocardioides cavernaquae TaxID=2321396 RepID=A0A3A5H8G7_9ACTN|nr:SGNH/GDSL hydrolase family protein [Nocardioides cavernaquae]RJS46946.1 SGNH/GDSL hydrolase family protein [Nocardioides cavernaquae]